MPSGRAALSWGFGLSLALHALWLAIAPQPRAHVRRAPPAVTSQLALHAGAPVELEVVGPEPADAAAPRAASTAPTVASATATDAASRAPTSASASPTATDANTPAVSPTKAPAAASATTASDADRASSTAPTVARATATATETNAPAVSPGKTPTVASARAADSAARAGSGLQGARTVGDVSSQLSAAAASAPRTVPLRSREQARASAAPPLPAAEPIGRDLGALERTLKRIAATTELTQEERRKAMLVVLRTWEDPSRNESAEQLIKTLLTELRPGEDR